MVVHGFVVGKPGMGETEKRAVLIGDEFYGHDGFGAFRSAGARHPGQSDKTVGDENEEAAIVRMALHGRILIGAEFRFEEEGCIDFAGHEDGAGGGKPLVELGSPGVEEEMRCKRHLALSGKLPWTGAEIGFAEDGLFGRHKDELIVTKVPKNAWIGHGVGAGRAELG